MKVKFKREGGFAGMILRREADDSELPDDAKRALQSLHELKRTVGAGSRRDGYLYTLEVEAQDPVVVSLNERSVTDEIAPLIRFFEAST